MNKLYSFVAFLFLASSLVAQPKVCKEDFQKALGLKNKGEYKAAATAFEKAAKCPGFMATERNQCKELAKTCNNLARKASTKGGNGKTKTGKNEGSKPKGKPEAERLFSGYLRATCNGSIRGAQMNVLVSAKNLTDNKLIVRCLISPKDGSGHVNTESPMAGDYTIEGGLSGQEQEVTFANEEEWVEVNIFVPFAVMDLAGNYAPQMMKSDLYIFQNGAKTPLAEYHDVYDALTTHTITLDGHIDDYELEVGYLGGLLELQPAVCSGNEVIWENIPSWITRDAAGLHVDGNNSPDDRAAIIHVFSSGGGNIINLSILQNGRSEDDRTTATINKTWLEEIMRNPAQNLKQLNVHVACEIVGANNKEVTLYAYFYCPDGTTPLLDDKGEQVVAWEKVFCDYAESAFDDIVLPMWLNSVTNAKNNKEKEARYYILFSEDDGQNWIGRYGPYTIKW